MVQKLDLAVDVAGGRPFNSKTDMTGAAKRTSYDGAGKWQEDCWSGVCLPKIGIGSTDVFQLSAFR